MTDTMNVAAPWIEHLDGIPSTLDYFQGSMFEAVERAAEQHPRKIAFDFMGRSTSYRELIENINKCARSLSYLGVKPGDKVTIALPNCPQAIYSFYGVNLIGAIANMVHPLASEKEMEFFLNESDSVVAITLDQFYHKFEAIRENTKVQHIVIASVKDELAPHIKAGYMLTEGRKIEQIPFDAPVIFWKPFMKLEKACEGDYRVNVNADDTAVILYSGGTTGKTKGIMLSNLNFNSSAEQIIATNPMFRPGDRMLAALPLFHGFGLGVCINAMLTHGGRCVLVPRFTAKSYAKLIVKYKCNFIAGVPTLFEALLRLPSMQRSNLSSLKGAFSGGDTLSNDLKRRIDEFFAEHHAKIQVREGYGMTETVTACCLTPVNKYKEGSIGFPFPDTYAKIVKPGTEEMLPYGEEGEILLSGPSVMQGYLNDPEESAKVLKDQADGRRWICTGDIGSMDEEGYLYFKGRIKRMIISSGYNVYPAQIENILESHPYVHQACVIGVPDSYRMQAVKAYVVLEPEVPTSAQTKSNLMDYCRKNIAKYAMPKDIVFKHSLPKTLVGKIAYRDLEKESEKEEKN
ncbi:MAG: AMP-binding protein [Lachnospiraceae bacterium]|nr:AMP-binding protein [Lachnospiraceae bacterium]